MFEFDLSVGNKVSKTIAVHAALPKLLLMCIMVLLALGQARASVPEECQTAARFAAQETGVPLSILVAITRTETGRRMGDEVLPWPWAMNLRGKGYYYESQAELLEAALEQIADGERRFDLGCFQINYHWHSSAFSSLDEMISPQSNALYAAHFLKSLFYETGDWTQAVGFYHSRTEELSRAYKTKVAAHLEAAPAFTELRSLDGIAPRKNSFPLLQTSKGRPRLGSLVLATSP